MDAETEAAIQRSLSEVVGGRTVVVIAHRLSTVRGADQIVVLNEGRIVERGTHAELLELGGRYRELYDRQYQLEHNLFINPGEDPTVDDDEEGAPRPAGARAVDPRSL